MQPTIKNKSLEEAFTAAIAASKLSGNSCSIQERAVLVRVSIGCIGNNRIDQTITEEVLKDKGMTADAGKGWSKYLYPPRAIKPILKAGAAIRTWHYSMTLPWSNEGWRMLPSSIFTSYTKALGDMIEAYKQLVESHFLSKLEAWEAEMRKALNGSFDESLYHTAHDLRPRFYVTWEVEPVPSGNDFRVALTNDELSAIRQSTDSKVSNAVNVAVEDLWRRLLEPVQAMAETLSQPDRKNKDGDMVSPIFRDSLVGNIRDIAKLAPGLNVTGSPEINRFAQKLADTLGKYDPEALRDSQPLRKEAADKAADIFNRMAEYMS